MSGFATHANGPLPVGGKKPQPAPQEQHHPQLRMVGIGVSPVMVSGVPAGGAITEVVIAKKEER